MKQGRKTLTTDELIRELRDIARIGNVNARHTLNICAQAADRLEEMDERLDIVSADLDEGRRYSGLVDE